MIPRRGSAKKKHEARVAWLLAHQGFLSGVPGIRDDVTDANRPALERLVGKLDALGLLGKTNVGGHGETVRRLVSELRGESIGAGQW